MNTNFAYKVEESPIFTVHKTAKRFNKTRAKQRQMGLVMCVVSLLMAAMTHDMTCGVILFPLGTYMMSTKKIVIERD